MTDTPAQADLPVEAQNDAALLAALRFNAGILASCGALSPKLAKAGMISEQVVEAADRIETLTRQLAEAQGRIATLRETADRATARADEAESQLAAQRERDGRDAARWRFVRANASSGPIFCAALPGGALNCDEPESEWDAAIDAALKDRP